MVAAIIIAIMVAAVLIAITSALVFFVAINDIASEQQWRTV
jgi:flagellar basal body-associated protein FliL